jgi:hypothetical protein
MTHPPALIQDGYYYSLSDFVLSSVNMLGTDMALYFEPAGKGRKGFEVKLYDVVALSDRREDKPLHAIRVDQEKTAVGLDVSLRLKRPEYENYKVLYLFDKVGPTGPVFRALAQRVELRYF